MITYCPEHHKNELYQCIISLLYMADAIYYCDNCDQGVIFTVIHTLKEIKRGAK